MNKLKRLDSETREQLQQLAHELAAFCEHYGDDVLRKAIDLHLQTQTMAASLSKGERVQVDGLRLQKSKVDYKIAQSVFVLI